MRFFVAIDDESQVSVAQVRAVLSTHCKREEYEVLPLPKGWLHYERKRTETLLHHVWATAKKILDRYDNAAFCIVVFQIETNQDGRAVNIDHALALNRRGKWGYKRLHEHYLERRFEGCITSPEEATGNLMEIALVSLARKYN